MRGKKQQRFQDIKEMSHVLEYNTLTQLPIDWQMEFGNAHPITLELACGKGEYTVELARRFPEKNFIGIDIKGNRIWVGAKIALEASLKNVRFLRIPIDHIDRYFPKRSISEMWIIYPDPFLRESKEKKRLTHERFLNAYQTIGLPHCVFHLKTDDPTLYFFTLTTLENRKASILTAQEDAYSVADETDPIRISTYYERLDIAQSKRVFYIRFSL